MGAKGAEDGFSPLGLFGNFDFKVEVVTLVLLVVSYGAFLLYAHVYLDDDLCYLEQPRPLLSAFGFGGGGVGSGAKGKSKKKGVKES